MLISCAVTVQLICAFVFAYMQKAGLLTKQLICKLKTGRPSVHLCRLNWNFVVFSLDMSHIMRKPTFCICENKGADQLCSNCTADQHLCFRYIDSTIPLLPKAETSNLYPYYVALQLGLCLAWSETQVLS